MATPVLQPAFAAGEISPELAARVDLEKYRVSCAKLRNFFIDYRGGAVNRAGTEFCGVDPVTAEMWIGDIYSRVIPFIYSADQTYAILVSPGRFRFLSNGGYVVGSTANITGITKANPGVITTSGVHGYAVDDLVYVSGIAGMTELNGRWFRVRSVPTTTTLTLKTPVSGNAVSTSSYGTYTSGGTLVRAVTEANPYSAADIADLKFVQSADVMTFFSTAYPPKALTRNSHTSWTLATITFSPSITPPSSGLSVSVNAGSGNTEYSYVITSISATNGDESEPSSETSTTGKYWTGDKSALVQWNAVSNALFYKIYRQPVVSHRGTPGSALFGLIGATKGTRFYDQQIAADYSQTPPISRNPFNASGKYPRCGTYHQQRLFFGSSVQQPNRVWGTVTASFSNMDQSIPPQDTDAVEFQLASTRIDPITNLLTMPGGLLCFTTGGVFHVSGDGQNAPLTPTSIVANQQTFVGAASLTPLAIDYNIIYSQADSNNVRNLIYNFFAQTYESRDLSDLASHLFRDYGIVDWAYAASPWKIIWGVREDGVLLSCTFYDKADMYAWAVHPTNGFVKSICVIPENGEDTVYLTVVRPISPRYETAGDYPMCIERMKSRQVDYIDEAWMVDCGESTTPNLINRALLPSSVDVGAGRTFTASGSAFVVGDVGKQIRGAGGLATITAYTSTTRVTATILEAFNNYVELAPGVKTPVNINPNEWSIDALFTTVSGLDHLEGQTVVGVANGKVVHPGVVANGTVTLSESASYCVLGLPRYDQLQTVRVELDPTVQGRRKRIPALTARFYKTGVSRFVSGDASSIGLKAGQDFDHMDSFRPDDFEDKPLYSGDLRISLDATWDRLGQVCIEQSDPLPVQVLGVIPEFNVGDN